MLSNAYSIACQEKPYYRFTNILYARIWTIVISDPVYTNHEFTNKTECSIQCCISHYGLCSGYVWEKLYSELGLTSLYDRRRFRGLSLFYKILNQLTSEYLRRFIPVSARRLLTTRAIRDNVVPTRTLKFRDSFFPDTSNYWYHLSRFIKTIPSLYIFQKRYMEFFNVTPT